MLYEEILKKAVDRAVGNGWNDSHRFSHKYALNETLIYDRYYSFIFSHDFAKAFWGEKESTQIVILSPKVKYEWQYHLYRMVLEPEPLKYLERFL